MHLKASSSSSIIIPESYQEEEEEEPVEELRMDPPSSHSHSQHQYNNNYSDFSQPTQPTQQTQTQQTQQEHSNEWPAHIWGILVSLQPSTLQQPELLHHQQQQQATTIITEPYVSRPDRIEFNWDKKLIKVGRHKNSDILLEGKKISSFHCEIRVELGVDGIGIVKLKDLSSNGTYVRGSKVGKGNTTILQVGDDVIFGPPTTAFSHDFRYTFTCPAPTKDSRYTSSGGGFFEEYELRDELGRGSFAIVRKAVQRKTGNTVAVKIISKSKFSGDPVTMGMFRREIEIMKTLDHPFCVGFVDFFEDESKLWLVLELSDGGDLLTYIMDRQGLNESDTRQIALMICQAVDYLHSVGIAHRDIKPENILMSKGSRPLCKVGDFGLAKMIDAGTKWKTMCGTPTYLAPEIIADTTPTEGYSNAVDAWSLGIVLYSCLTNSTPFDESESTPLRQRVEARVVDFSVLRENKISEVAIDFLSKFLTNDPNKRMSVHDSLKHPWLDTTTPKNGTKSLDALVSSTLPYNSRSQPITAGPANPNNLGDDLMTITTGISGEGSSFVYSQQLGELRLGTRGRSSLASSLQSTTTPDRTMEVDSNTTVENESTIMPTKFNNQSMISPLGKRSRDSNNDNEDTEPNSAFSSMSSIGTPYRNNRVESNSGTTLNGLGTAIAELEVLSQHSVSESEASAIGRLVTSPVKGKEEEGEEELEPISTRASRAKKARVVGTGGTKRKGVVSKAIESTDVIPGEGIMTRRRAKVARLS